MPMSDVEEMQLVKAWVKEYGYYILFSIVVFMIASFGWRYLQKNKHYKLEHASSLYSQMTVASSEKKTEELQLFGKKLVKDYPKSIYATLSGLMLAKHYVESGYLKSAEESLQVVIKKSPSKEIAELARVRRARILIAINKPQKALDLLSAKDHGLYAAEVSEVRGDALLKLGKVTEAETSYRNADRLSKDKKPPLLKIKMQQF